MSRLSKFFALPAADQRLLMKAAAHLAGTSLGLRLLPFSSWRHRLGDTADAAATPAGTSRQPAERIAWAVGAASSYVPGATCLVQAVVARSMMVRQGFPAQVRIGVRVGETSRVEAHAWLELDGQVILGNSSGDPHVPLEGPAGSALQPTGTEHPVDSTHKTTDTRS